MALKFYNGENLRRMKVQFCAPTTFWWKIAADWRKNATFCPFYF